MDTMLKPNPILTRMHRLPTHRVNYTPIKHVAIRSSVSLFPYVYMHG
uniref:Uncharacterized protein n=1 Tax=Setaria italica TaxID=4555 RepID=K3ZFV0_SETIT